MKKDINKVILGYFKKSDNEWIQLEIVSLISDYILTEAFNYENDYNTENNEDIEIDFIEILEDKKNIEIKYYYGNGYILQSDTWDNMKELLSYLKKNK